ncbi:MAG: PH domain-containing protein [Clostridia bacterium]|nr:PH domain-containing protein [Clostridia bacterium]
MSENDTLICEGKFSKAPWRFLFYTFLAVLVVFAVSVVLTVVFNGLIKLAFLFFAIFFGLLTLYLAIICTKKSGEYKSTKLVVTDNKIAGISADEDKTAFECELYRIENVTLNQSLIGRIFKYASLTVKTSIGVYFFPAITNGEELKTLLMDLALKAKDKSVIF